MMFIIILIALVVERFFDWHHVRRWYWFDAYSRWISKKINRWAPFWLLLFKILPILVIVGFIVYLASNWLYGVPELILGTLILIYCLGPDNWWEEAYRAMRTAEPEDHASQAEGVMFIKANQRLFAVIFWFVLAGPMGAILYRLVNLMSETKDQPESVLATSWKKWLDWLPIRVFAIFFALAGHFTEVFAYLKKHILSGVNANDDLLETCGMKALDIKQQDSVILKTQIVSLIDRVFIMVLVFLAIIVLILA